MPTMMRGPLVVLAFLCLITGCGEQDPASQQVRSTLDLLAGYRTIATDLATGMRPWFEGETVDGDLAQRLERRTEDALATVRSQVEALPTVASANGTAWHAEVDRFMAGQEAYAATILDAFASGVATANPITPEARSTMIDRLAEEAEAQEALRRELDRQAALTAGEAVR